MGRDLRVAGKYDWGVNSPDSFLTKPPLVVRPSIKGHTSCEVALSIWLPTSDSNICSTSCLFRSRSSDIQLWLPSVECMSLVRFLKPFLYLCKYPICSTLFRWTSLNVPSVSCQTPGWYASLAGRLVIPGPKSGVWDCETWVHYKIYTWLLQWSQQYHHRHGALKERECTQSNRRAQGKLKYNDRKQEDEQNKIMQNPSKTKFLSGSCIAISIAL